MSREDNLVRVILTSREGNNMMRMYFLITREAEQLALKLLDMEKAPITDNRRTDIFKQAMHEFPVEEE